MCAQTQADAFLRMTNSFFVGTTVLLLLTVVGRAYIQVGSQFPSGVVIGSDGETPPCSPGTYGLVRYSEDADSYVFCSKSTGKWSPFNSSPVQDNLNTGALDSLFCNGQGTYVFGSESFNDDYCECHRNYTGFRCEDCVPGITRDGNEECTVRFSPDDVPYSGDLTISGTLNIETTNTGNRSCADGGDAVSYRVNALAHGLVLSVTLSSAPSSGCLNLYDWVVLQSMQGVSAGAYEMFRVHSIVGSTVMMTYASHNFSSITSLNPTDDVLVLRRVPYYGSVVGNSGTFTANAWNGVSGGVVMFRATSMSGTGSISMNGKGYRGGALPVSDSYGNQGESYLPNSQKVSSATSTSRYNNHGGGGGGGNPGETGPWWPLGAGGGSHGTRAVDAANHGCQATISNPLGGASVSFQTGHAGDIYGTADLRESIFMGSGGGSGGRHGSHTPGIGGNGGGAIAVFLDDGISGTWSMQVSGNDGVQDRSSGGGGAGGAVLVTAPNSRTFTTAVDGGSGFRDPTSTCDGNLGGMSGFGGSGRVYESATNWLFDRVHELP